MFLTRLSRVRRRTRGEAGQTLVEYALIIAVVSLGAVAALTFLRDEITAVFNDSGSALSDASAGAGGTGSGGSGGGGGGGGTSTPPTSGAPIISNPNVVIGGSVPTNAFWSPSVESSLIDVGAGILLPGNTPPAATTCSISFTGGNTFTFNGTWVPDPPGAAEPIWQSGGSGSGYHWACVGPSAFATPTSGQTYSAYKEFDDDRIDQTSATGTYTYFTSLNGHGSAGAGGAGVYRPMNEPSSSSGTRAFFFTSGGIFVCTWGTSLSNQTTNHWTTNTGSHTSGETLYVQRCS